MSETQNDDLNPYSAPVDTAPLPESVADPKWRRLRSFAIVLIIVAGLIGVVGTMLRMIMAFRMAAEQQNMNAGQLAGSVSTSTLFLVGTAPLLLLGVVLLIVSMAKLRQ